MASYLDKHPQHRQAVRLVHGVAKVPVLGVVMHQVQLRREGFPVHGVLTAPSILPAPVSVELSQLVDIILQWPSAQTWSNSLRSGFQISLYT